MLNLVLFGPPGAGKGTQSKKLIEEYGLVHVSTGDVFRANIKNGTELGVLAKSYMDRGELVPDEVTVNMLNSVVDEHPKAEGFIFDGFPRTTPQANALDKLMESKGTEISGMIALEVPEEELKERLRKRAEDSGRTDDADPEVIANRIKVYKNETAPLKKYYEAQDKFYSINGEGDIDEITSRLFETVESIK